MIERYEKEMRRMFESAPKAQTGFSVPDKNAVEAAVFPEDALQVPRFQQKEQTGEEISEQPLKMTENPMPVPQNLPSPEQPIPDKIGSIIVEVTTARGAVPLSGVAVVIDRLDADDPKNRQELIAVLSTDVDGRTKPVEVQTVSRDLSLSPGSPNPFATFYVSAKADGFEPVKSRPVDVFSEEMSILKIDLVPKPEKLGEGGMY